MSRTAEEAIGTCLTDMLALEEGIEGALKAQVEELHDEPQALVMALDAIQVTVQHHVASLREIVRERAAPVPAGGGGAAAGLTRAGKLSADLRDDYAAFSRAMVSYVALLSTAMSLKDQPAAELAERHLRQYARVVMKLNSMLPSAVIAELREEGLAAREEELPAIARTLKGVWSDPHNEVPDAGEVGVT